MVKNKKGFTLVELLAVIVVLVIITVIAINKISSVMRKNNENAVIANASAFIKNVEENAGMYRITGKFGDGLYSVDDLFDMGITIKGTKPKNGQVYIISGKVYSACLVYDKFIDNYEYGKNTVEKSQECGEVSTFDYSFAYTGSEEVLEVPLTGLYKLEVWGAQGGTADTFRGGYGSYSVGEIELNANTKLYINVGGQGTGNRTVSTGGYNGGGSVVGDADTNRIKSSGGGATHIATSSGQLSSLASNKTSVIIVAGGGGGGYKHNTAGYAGVGGDAGGYVGVNGESTGTNNYYGIGATQTSGGCSTDNLAITCGTFGKGGTTGNQTHGSAGGAGWYGGGASSAYSGNANASGAGGSGYIGNSRLSNKSMYCYNCSESNASDTKTISTTCAKEEATKNCAKIGDGYVRISLAGATTNSVKDNSFQSKFSNFTQLEYIASSGSSYIDTGIASADDVGVHAVLSSNDVTNDNIYFGSKGSGDSRLWVGNYNADTYFGWNTNTYASSSLTTSTKQDIKLNYLNDRAKNYNNNYIMNNIPTLNGNTYNIYIFAGNNSGTANYHSSIKLYSFKLSKGTSVVRDYVPCKSTTNNTSVGLCDMITGNFYAGSGTFTPSS